MPRYSRSSVIHRRQRRHRKLAQLRKRYGSARTESERNQVLAKVRRVSPWVTTESFVAALPPKTAEKSGRAAKG